MKQKTPDVWEPVFFNKKDFVSPGHSPVFKAYLKEKSDLPSIDWELDYQELKNLNSEQRIRKAVERVNYTKEPVLLIGDDDRVEAVILDYNMFRAIGQRVDGDFGAEAKMLRQKDPRPEVI